MPADELSDAAVLSLIELANSLKWQTTPESSNVAGLAYHDKRRLLFVMFTEKGKPDAKGKHRKKRGSSETLYVYFDVPRSVYLRFKSASSKGQFVFHEIRKHGTDSKYDYEQLE